MSTQNLPYKTRKFAKNLGTSAKNLGSFAIDLGSFEQICSKPL